METYNIYPNYNKYYETYEDDTYYLYLKNNYYFIEILNKNKLIINNPNSINIYNKHPYKFICNNPSWSMNDNPIINHKYLYYISIFTNKYCCNTERCYSCRSTIYSNDIGNSINIGCLDDSICLGRYKIDGNILIYYNNHGTTKITNFDNNYYNYAFELDNNKGARMIKHNLTNNIPSYIYRENYNDDELIIQNYYFIEEVYIEFPLISIYDEYDYIQNIISGITDIYNLPIIPPIKFI